MKSAAWLMVVGLATATGAAEEPAKTLRQPARGAWIGAIRSFWRGEFMGSFVYKAAIYNSGSAPGSGSGNAVVTVFLLAGVILLIVALRIMR